MYFDIVKLYLLYSVKTFPGVCEAPKLSVIQVNLEREELMFSFGKSLILRWVQAFCFPLKLSGEVMAFLKKAETWWEAPQEEQLWNKQRRPLEKTDKSADYPRMVAEATGLL